MKHVILIGAVALGLATPGYAQSVPERTGINPTLGISPSTQDFVTLAANSDMLEIEASKLALSKADEKSKAFASKMIADHTQTSTELKELVGSGKVKASLPPTTDKTHQSKLEKLQGLSGAEFDEEYDEMQVAAHKDAVSLFDRYAKGGDNSDLRSFAGKWLPHLQEHLKMAEGLEK
jgi:putative membrane protein